MIYLNYFDNKTESELAIYVIEIFSNIRLLYKHMNRLKINYKFMPIKWLLI